MKDRPGVIAPPPLLFLVFFIAGWLAGDVLPPYHANVAATVLAIFSAALMSWAFITMHRARTNIDPYKPATTVVTTGPFRVSRNPIYLSMNGLYVAAALRTGSMSSLVLLPVANVILHFGVIRREERYLEQKFGDAYRVYRAKVRRWL